MKSKNFNDIRPGSRVSLLVPGGLNRDGSVVGKVVAGRAVMRGPYGWAVNLGGPYGRPGVVGPANFVAVSVGNAVN